MIREYFAALRREWIALMTGALTIPFTAAAFFMDAVWQRIAFGAFAFSCFLFSSYRVWAAEHRRANELVQAKTVDVLSLHEANTRHENTIAVLRETIAKLQPRTIADSQKECIRKRLAPLTNQMRARDLKLQIILSADEGEGWDTRDYAREFEEFLSSLGFKVSRYRRSGEHEGDDYRRGIWFRWSTEREQRYVLPFGQIFVDALKSCEIEITPSDHPDWAFYELIIGARNPS